MNLTTALSCCFAVFPSSFISVSIIPCFLSVSNLIFAMLVSAFLMDLLHDFLKSLSFSFRLAFLISFIPSSISRSPSACTAASLTPQSSSSSPVAMSSMLSFATSSPSPLIATFLTIGSSSVVASTRYGITVLSFVCFSA